MAESDQAVRDIVQQLVSGGDAAQAEPAMAAMMAAPAQPAQRFGMMPVVDQMIERARGQLDSQPERVPAPPQKFGMMDTWPVRLAQSAYNAALAPGRALASTEPVTSEQLVAPATDLAGLLTVGAGSIPAEANSLRAGVRPYQNVPQSLMGYRKSGPQRGFGETNYSHQQPVEVTFKNGDSFTDAVEGMNADHAVERAYRNWPDAIHIRAIN